ncbi:MAG: hypothetical protein WD042_05055 [Phycisphaeraceae bacterium]
MSGLIPKMGFAVVTMTAAALVLISLAQAAPADPAPTGATTWPHGPPTDPAFFPLAVWLQQPRNAPKFKALGINTYVGLWDGPTEEQLAELKKHDMKVICGFNDVSRKHLNDPTIIGWMHGDEPDNAQAIERWKSEAAIREAWPDVPKKSLKEWGPWGPPIPPKAIVADYQRLRQADPTRPILLNLGQGVAYDNYIGRGYRRGQLDDYPQYLQGADIVSFDIYPVVHDQPEVAGKLEYVPRGVERLVKWSDGKKTVWNCIECTHISNPPAIASPQQIRTQVWMSLIHGSRGLIYFVHEFEPRFIEPGVLAHPDQAQAIAAVNKQILSLASVLNQPTLSPGVEVRSSEAKVPVAAMTKEYEGSLYVLAVAMRDAPTTATFRRAGLRDGQVEVIDEGRTVTVKNGVFQDEFEGYGVHLYKVK